MPHHILRSFVLRDFLPAESLRLRRFLFSLSEDEAAFLFLLFALPISLSRLRFAS